jgi:hypothetical protein
MNLKFATLEKYLKKYLKKSLGIAILISNPSMSVGCNF